MKIMNVVFMFVCTSFISFLCIAACFCENPDIEVNGIIKDPNGSLALIDGNIVKQGDVIDGAEVVKIANDGVVFKYEGKEYLQRVSSTQSKVSAPATTPTKTASISSAINAQNSSSSGISSTKSQSTPMKTLYGMPIETFFPKTAEEAFPNMPIMPSRAQMLDPATGQQMVAEAQRMKDQAIAKQREVYEKIKEMEEQ